MLGRCCWRCGHGKCCPHRVPDAQSFAFPAKWNLASMLPGFRFLFAAIILSTSILIFGLGAAALLRTAHEEFASAPTWQPAPETRFEQTGDATKDATGPVLALLRVDAAPKVEMLMPDADLNADAAPNKSQGVPAEPAATRPPEAAEIAELPHQPSPPTEAAKPEAPVADTAAAKSPAAYNPV